MIQKTRNFDQSKKGEEGETDFFPADLTVQKLV